MEPLLDVSYPLKITQPPRPFRLTGRLRTVGFVKWAYFGSHSRDLVHDVGTASGSAYHLVHQQEQEANGGATPCRSDNWVVGCGHDGRCGLIFASDGCVLVMHPRRRILYRRHLQRCTLYLPEGVVTVAHYK